MNFIFCVLAGLLIAGTQATFNFRSTCNTANNQMISLSQYLSQIKAIADQNGHRAISAKCIEASQHLTVARSSWNTVSSAFGSSPWGARSSPYAGQCQSRLSSCGSCINWIFGRPEVARVPAYRIPLLNCRNGHRSCQTTCGQIWNWPSPPGYNPKPSGYRRVRRESPQTLCSAKETACPISPNATGEECIDTQTEITSCGGCVTTATGENCLSIEGADEVGCEAGVCRVFSVLPGFEMSAVSQRPVPK